MAANTTTITALKAHTKPALLVTLKLPDRLLETARPTRKYTPFTQSYVAKNEDNFVVPQKSEEVATGHPTTTTSGGSFVQTRTSPKVYKRRSFSYILKLSEIHARGLSIKGTIAEKSPYKAYGGGMDTWMGWDGELGLDI